MNLVSFLKRDLQLVIQYLSIARITGLSKELDFSVTGFAKRVLCAQYYEYLEKIS